ncbi:fibronectin type III domain-containing protein, partial [Klebsiella pneumoniae]|uniref:fibronectin type III domain-containing protein n=1 Tax=Klebsiella pneumoniae TaxID=573 RepID=UPI003B980911
EYNDHPLMPAVGFKLYNELDIVVDTVPLEVRDRYITGLNPDTMYYFYVTAYNQNGDSLPSNKVRVKTLKVYDDDDKEDEDDKTPSKPLNDPLGDLTYDKETVGMEKIRAFQSGIGDRLDLAVRNFAKPGDVLNAEEFDCQMYVKGLYQKEAPKFVDVPFKFRVTCEGIDERTKTPYKQTSDWKGAIVRGGDNGMTFTAPTQMETPNYVIEKRYSIEVQDLKGNQIPMNGGENAKVNWSLEPYEAKDKIGWVQEIYMRNVF